MIAQSLVNAGGEKRTIVHNRARSLSPPYYPPLYPRLCTPTIVHIPGGVGALSTDTATAGRASETPHKDWEQAANIAILKAMVRFPGREPASTWQLARKAAEWMRQTQIKYPEKAVPDYLLKKIMDEYQKLPVMP